MRRNEGPRAGRETAARAPGRKATRMRCGERGPEAVRLSQRGVAERGTDGGAGLALASAGGWRPGAGSAGPALSPETPDGFMDFNRREITAIIPNDNHGSWGLTPQP